MPTRIRFLADSNVGRLARWLRALGYDAEYRPELGDAELVKAALADDRVLLTRDRDLTQRRAVASGLLRCVLLRSDAVEDQLRQVTCSLGLDQRDALSRCLECNLPLESRSLQQVRELVPPHVRATRTQFSQCPGCVRVYWAGTHWQRMHARFGRLLEAS